NAMLERLERSFHQANRFSADASHELKTPLAIMRGMLEQGLDRCEGDPDAQEVFSQLLVQTGRQGAILENLLLLSRADAGRLEISAVRFSLSDHVETWIEDAGFLAEPRGISIESHAEPGIEIAGDPVLLQQVAHNLFSNAVRYNVDGGRIISELTLSGSSAEWRIANTGELVPAHDRERVFERFERSQRQEDSPNDGVGLGLSLVKEIILAHGGRVAMDANAEGLVEIYLAIPVN
ncbi:MAG: HAMP domain-containing sensor histidine kinase, partial [Verrucomicrobiota bacterium]